MISKSSQGLAVTRSKKEGLNHRYGEMVTRFSFKAPTIAIVCWFQQNSTESDFNARLRIGMAV